jgi:mannose-6-phosphate isomerase-like protein (cupin superfamily)
MAGNYTVTKLSEVEDSAPKFGYGEHQEARFARGDLGLEQLGLSFHRVKPGQRQGFGHRHDVAEEIYVVTSGSGRLKVDDDILEVAPGDAIRVGPGATRQWEGGPEGIELLAFGAHHENESELIPGWWQD